MSNEHGAMNYPQNWPRCPVCGDFALDGHITCGHFNCNEGKARRNKLMGSVTDIFDRTTPLPPEDAG